MQLPQAHPALDKRFPAPDTTDESWNVRSPDAQDIATVAQQDPPTISNPGVVCQNSSRTGDGKEGSEMLFARLADSDERPRRSECHGGSTTIYLGEPYSLSYVVHEGFKEVSHEVDNANGPGRMHYPIPDTLDQRARNIPYESCDALFEKDELRLLQRKGALTILEPGVHECFLRTYFECFHPAFPILNKEEFLGSVDTNPPSVLILQAMYFIASTHIEENIILKAGFNSRYAARLTFYKRAKVLYDADYDSNSVTVVQVLFLMSFWWGGPTDQKDTWHWLGAAIGLAQTKGMHRS